LKLIQGDCFKIIPTLSVYDCLFADPPDAIGLKYQNFKDVDPETYPNFLWDCFNLFVTHAKISWISYNAKWTYLVGSLVCRLLARHRNIEAKPFIQTFTFGQNNRNDCGNGHRPLLRLKHKDAKLYPEQIKVESWRQKHGDKRAKPGGCVPLDCWDFPRVVGNSKQRRKYHPTQLHEGLVERCVKLSTAEGDRVLDVFSGTGTTIRVCKRINRGVTSIEINPFYCKKLKEEHDER